MIVIWLVIARPVSKKIAYKPFGKLIRTAMQNKY